ncbi:MAG TPA: LysR family transcriptional regulator [Pseudonocardia sp.]|nr:LysR family transcriptional regulator [Pseudonocardia sp.]
MTEFTVVGLRVLREVAAMGSFSAAAQALGYTQSAISRQVAALEATAGGALFTRTNRGVRLTEAGAVLVRHGAAVLDQLAAAEHELASRAGRGARRVRLGGFPSAMATLVPRAITRLRGIAPELTVTLREGTTPALLRRLAAGSVDVAVVGAELDRVTREHPELAAEWLLDDPLLLAVGRAHPLATAASVTPGELARERWIIGSTDSSEPLLGAWVAADWTPEVAFTARDWAAKLGLVAAGLGVTIVPGLSAAAVPDGVLCVRIADPRASRPVLLARPASATTGEPSQAVVVALRASAAE